MAPTIEHTTIGPNSSHPLTVPRILTGLWQLAGGHDANLDLDSAAEHMGMLVRRGLTGFDMADHYGVQPAELVTGKYKHRQHAQPMTAFTKWCPQPDPSPSLTKTEQAVDLARERMGRAESLDLLQFHAWKYDDRSWLPNLDHLSTLQTKGKIHHIGVTNFDLPHLRLIHHTGLPIATNQISLSILDRRAERNGMAKWCVENGVGILAYGVLLGGFLSEKWLGQQEPTADELTNWSLRKYKRFIDVTGGWEAFQTLLRAISLIATKHCVGISTIAVRYVLDIPGVSCAILGSTLTPRSLSHTDSSLQAFEVELDDDDREMIKDAQRGLKDVPGGNGDEYRREPHLTASGDLSHHLQEDDLDEVEDVVRNGGRVEYSSGSPWEPIAGYCRGVRYGPTISIAGTTASVLPSGVIAGGSNAASQTISIFDVAMGALTSLGATLKDVTRTRILLRNVQDCKAVVRIHGEMFEREGVRPVNTTVGGIGMVGEEMLVEIDFDAIVGAGRGQVLRI